ncbi:TonB-dependent receptor [Sphingomonas sp. KR1UV-12]|uniref:TonB-dependent receptor n=1 Tax=Sphingomonas aurea TaxID=3063994 RepID=A0ABT9ELY6_9SPHN|nr:TonB-dependent receptor [Sphingomonas sp. KR1UV-12]MDP1027974.1 TonB-dependent receptor [Sphingomonas sp. KR1UV-12]
MFLTSGAMTALIAGSAAQAQTSQASSVARNASADAEATSTSEQDILVVGLRKSVKEAVERKRKSKQIVDSVVAEDAGKLPDNNVIEALARVTGVQISRSRGEGSGLTIRGLSDVQTTVNGNNANQGEGRSINLADVPAELIKAIDVYKTRSPDQVEGGVGGSVNIELRRPLDLKEGLTVAGSVRGVYSDNPKKVSPFASLLVSKRMDTNIGQIGFLLNGSFQKNYYRETFVSSEGIDNFCCSGDANSPLGLLPAAYKDLASPYRVNYGLDQGRNKKKALSASVQWKPNDNLEFVLEGSYINSQNNNQYDGLYLAIREGVLSNITTLPDGKTLVSATVGPRAAGQRPPAGFTSQAYDSNSDFYSTNFETTWRSGIATVHASAQYSWSKNDAFNVELLPIVPGATTATVDLVSDRFAGGGPFITFPGVDLTNINNYIVDRYQDRRYASKNKEFSSQLDIELALSDSGLLRRFKTGVRFMDRLPSNSYGYRDGYPRQSVVVNGVTTRVGTPLSAFPGADAAGPVSALVPGAEALSWVHIPGRVLIANVTANRQYIVANDPANAALWSTDEPPSDRGQVYRASENSFAFYGLVDYGFKLGFPVDGQIGARVINTFGSASSTNFAYGPLTDNPTISAGRGRANYVDILPTLTATIHFTNKFQLRLSRTTNIQRADFYNLRPSAIIDQFRIPTYVYTGNPKIKPSTAIKYDASLEYYLPDGVISLAGFINNQDGLLFYYDRPANLAAYGINEDGFISSLYNAGKGKNVGVEANLQTFFRFLPGVLRNFGIGLNGTWIPTATQKYPYADEEDNDVPGANDVTGLSKYTGNATLFYETPSFSTRVSYNYRSRFRNDVNYRNPIYSSFTQSTSRLDAAINYTPVKFITFSLEGTNLLRNNDKVYYGIDKLLPQGGRLQPRTVQLSARFRY